MKYLPGIIGIVVICIEIYRWVRGRWIRHVLEGIKERKCCANQQCSAPRVNWIARIAWKKRGKRQMRSKKKQSWPGVSGKGEVVDERATQPKGTFVQMRGVTILGLGMRISMRWCGMGGMESRRRFGI
jgi:hypothetical protein